jgi:hypothetical protein
MPFEEATSILKPVFLYSFLLENSVFKHEIAHFLIKKLSYDKNKTANSTGMEILKFYMSSLKVCYMFYIIKFIIFIIK